MAFRCSSCMRDYVSFEDFSLQFKINVKFDLVRPRTGNEYIKGFEMHVLRCGSD